MRIVILGAGEIAVRAAEQLIERNCEVILVEKDRTRIEDLEEGLDCGFLHGDGTSPNILEEANPSGSDILMCLTDSDQANIIASLIGRSLGFDKVVTRIEDPEFESICRELKLENVVIPSRTTGLHLADLAQDKGSSEFSGVLKDEARLFGFTAEKNDCRKVSEMKLPEKSKVICCFRDGSFLLLDPEDAIREGDEVIVLTHSDHYDELEDRWLSEEALEGEKDEEG